MPWTLLFSLLGSLPGAFGKYFDNKTQVELQKQQNLLAIEQEKSKLIAQGIIAQGELGQVQIQATDKWFKEAFYGLLLFPIIITCIDPVYGKQIFSSLNLVPEWYIIFITTIGFAVWGISSDKLASVIQARREYKLEKLKINRADYFAAKRQLQGTISQQEVDEDNKVLDKLDNQ